MGSILKARRDGEAPSKSSGNNDFDEFIHVCLAKERNKRATLQDVLQTKFMTDSANFGESWTKLYGAGQNWQDSKLSKVEKAVLVI